MAITDATRRALLRRAGGRCECRMRVCDHHAAGTRCKHGLYSPHWAAHYRSRLGGDIPSNLIAMCATCQKNTRTFGKPR